MQKTIATILLKQFQGLLFDRRRAFHRHMAINPAPSGTGGSTYHWHEGVENPEKYRVGGYHSIQLGEEYSQGRYQVINKLGHGSFSTVWLARDHEGNRYAALKVMTAAASELSSEAKIRQRLSQTNAHHPGSSSVLSLLVEFWINGRNGRHQCLVSEVVGPSVIEAREACTMACYYSRLHGILQHSLPLVWPIYIRVMFFTEVCTPLFLPLV